MNIAFKNTITLLLFLLPGVNFFAVDFDEEISALENSRGDEYIKRRDALSANGELLRGHLAGIVKRRNIHIILELYIDEKTSKMRDVIISELKYAKKADNGNGGESIDFSAFSKETSDSLSRRRPFPWINLPPFSVDDNNNGFVDIAKNNKYTSPQIWRFSKRTALIVEGIKFNPFKISPNILYRISVGCIPTNLAAVNKWGSEYGFSEGYINGIDDVEISESNSILISESTADRSLTTMIFYPQVSQIMTPGQIAAAREGICDGIDEQGFIGLLIGSFACKGYDDKSPAAAGGDLWYSEVMAAREAFGKHRAKFIDLMDRNDGFSLHLVNAIDATLMRRTIGK